MKKLIAIALIAVMLLGLAACGTINKAEVSILWSGDSTVKVPNSLINAVERAMYIENISYKHYGANGDQAVQTKQAEDALKAGCSALVVELVDAAAAQTIVDAAKAKNVPVVFINCTVEEAVVKSYGKCVLVDTDESSMASVLGQMIGDKLVELVEDKNFEKYDRNGDGKITYLALDNGAAPVEYANAVLAENDLPGLEAVNASFSDLKAENYTVEEKVFFFFKKVTEYGKLTSGDSVVELILTDNDASAKEVFTALQEMGFNKDKLATHYVPVYTVGDSIDYKELVLSGKPAGAHTDDNIQEYFKSMQYIVDLRTVAEEDLPTMIYTTGNIISDGRIAGTAIEDYDGIAVSAANALAKLLKGTALDKAMIAVPYTTLG